MLPWHLLQKDLSSPAGRVISSPRACRLAVSELGPYVLLSRLPKDL